MSRESVGLLFATLIVVASLSAAPLAQESGASFRFEPDDTVCLLGNGLAERMQHHGWLETRLQARLPNLGLTFRNLGFSADELTIQQRTSGFGSWDEHLSRVGADVVFAFFGFNESFAGEAGLQRFREDLAAFITHTRAQRYNGEDAPRLVLFSPLPYEGNGDPLLPQPGPINQRLTAYSQAMQQVAAVHAVPFVDLFSAMVQWRTRPGSANEPRLTINGVHLHERGNELVAGMIERLLVGEATASETPAWVLQDIRSLVLDKNLLWFNRYRATDGFNVYGGRSSLTYDGVTNFEVLQHELVVIDALAANLDRDIHAAAQGRSMPQPLPVPDVIPVKTNRPGPLADGKYPFKSGEEALAAMTPAPGMQIELYADESMFPELVNPVQMAFDTQGRLWVATWPTYPHWAPGQPMNDALLILEDTDGDGRADTCVPFVDDLHNPTGFEFWNGGVFVANAPDILFLKDTDGDGVADVRERVLSGISSGDTHHSANSFVLGPGGGLYFQEGTFHQSQVESIYGPVRNNNGCVWRFEPRTWRVQRYVPYGFANPHGHVFDRWGQDFVTDGTGNVNYYALAFSGYVEAGRNHGGYFPFFQQRSRPCAATEILSSGHFPSANQGNYLVANVIGFQGIFQYEINDDGSGFSATEVDPIVHSTDTSFRPTDMEIGPDGALYFVDWQNPIIGHMQHHLRDPSRDSDHGRVYRVSMTGRDLLEPVPVAGQPVETLLELLQSDDDRVRYRVRIELSGRDSAQVVSAAKRWATVLADGNDEHALLEALWLQQQHGVLDHGLLNRMLRSTDFRARAAAVRVLRWMYRDVRRPLDLLADAVTDDHPRVRLEALVALSEFQDARAAELALVVLSRPTDRFLDYALKETLKTLAPYWREALGSGELFAADDPLGLAYALTRLDSDALAGVHPSAPLYKEVLSRHGLDLSLYQQAVEGLAVSAGSAPVHELLSAIQRADARADGHVDHLLIGLFDVLSAMPNAVFRSLGDALTDLSQNGRRASTRRLATAARLRADGSAEPSWSEASRSLASLNALLDAAPMVRDEAIARELFPKVAALLDGLPPALAADPASVQGVVGKSVRIELPGDARTLTLAEVQVFSRGVNIAPQGTASQSTTNWGGVAARAIDGNTNGVYGQGGQTHTRENEPDTWWQLDLPGHEPLDRIVVWNRTDSGGRYASRLDGYVLTVFDDQGRSVFRSAPQPAPEEFGELQLTAPALRVRRAAVRCLGELGVFQSEAVAALLVAFNDDALRATAVDALAAISIDAWAETDVDGAGRRLQRLFEQQPSKDFESLAGRRMLALADHVGQRLGGQLGRDLARLRRGLGPQIIVIRPVRDSLTYDVQQFTVQAGRPVELLFVNTDLMPHNLLVAEPGSLSTVGLAGEAMAAEPDAWERAFVPSLPEVLIATGLLQPGDQELLVFDAPEELGDYPYLCTFPGHWIRMNGVMTVVDELPEGQLIVSSEPRAHADTSSSHDHSVAMQTRTFVKLWTVDALSADLEAVDAADPVLGQSILEQASCLRCHSIDDEPGGAQTGPSFVEALSRHDRAGLLTSLLDPSALISEGYESEMLFLANGTVTAGRVLSEDRAGVTLLADPYSSTTTVVPHYTIAERRVSSISTMPEGLLMTFEREEILALIAYLESLRP
jgi:putative heme-binding domain-containing protein